MTPAEAYVMLKRALELQVRYQKVPSRERLADLLEAIQLYEAALRVRTERDFPEEWAATQNNLGNA